MANEQLCWSCKNACGACSWSRCLQPVKGWKAVKVQRRDGETYHIEECPEYINDGSNVKKKQKATRVTEAQKKRILELHSKGYKQYMIAREVKVSNYLVGKVIKTGGKTH